MFIKIYTLMSLNIYLINLLNSRPVLVSVSFSDNFEADMHNACLTLQHDALDEQITLFNLLLNINFINFHIHQASVHI